MEHQFGKQVLSCEFRVAEVCVCDAGMFSRFTGHSASLKRSLGTDEFSRKRGGVEEKSLEKDGRPVLFYSTTRRTAGGNPETF